MRLRRGSSLVLLLLLVAFAGRPARAQKPSMAQDAALDNLLLPSGVQTVPYGTLGNVRKEGRGPRAVLLIPGLGFGDDIWSEFIERHRDEFTMYAVTLPGFGGTAPLAMPTEGPLYATTPWTRSAIAGIERLIEKEHLQRVTVVAHWALATQIALRLALDHPDRVDAVVLLGGALKSVYEAAPQMATWTLEQRVRGVEALGLKWFKTVTRETWDDNNFMPNDYAVGPRRGLLLWRRAQTPLLPVWIRYLLEFYSLDPTAELKSLRVPVLVVQPGFDDAGFVAEPGGNYMRNLCHDSWGGVAQLGVPIQFTRIPQSRLFLMADRPEETDRAMREFLDKTGEVAKPAQPRRQGRE